MASGFPIWLLVLAGLAVFAIAAIVAVVLSTTKRK